MYSFINGLQTFTREVQILGAACLFIRMCDVWKANPIDVMNIAQNIMDKNPNLEQFRASDEYFLNELYKHNEISKRGFSN